jgi:hypothetical protein
MHEFVIGCDIPALRTLKYLICSITLLTEMITAAIFNFDTYNVQHSYFRKQPYFLPFSLIKSSFTAKVINNLHAFYRSYK